MLGNRCVCVIVLLFYVQYPDRLKFKGWKQGKIRYEIVNTHLMSERQQIKYLTFTITGTENVIKRHTTVNAEKPGVTFLKETHEKK